MQPTKSKKALTIFGIVLMTLAGGAFFWYEWGGGREMINYDEILVLKEDVKQGKVITTADLVFQKVEKTSVIKGVISKPNEVVGKEAKHFIPSLTQLHSSYFDESGLVLKKGQVVAQIPVEWTLSVPDTLRRGDEIIVYAALYDKQLQMSLQSTRTQEVVSSKPKENEEKDEESTTEEITVTAQAGLDSELPNELQELLTTKVAYVKDGSNKEVVTTSTNDRLDASSVIQNVEIITTPEEFKKIEQKINKGGKLIVMYGNEIPLSDTKTDSEEE